MNLMHTSTPTLLWWWYGDDVAYSMFRFLQCCLNLPETKLLPASNIVFLGKPYSGKLILHDSIKLSAERSSVFFMTRNFPC